MSEFVHRAKKGPWLAPTIAAAAAAVLLFIPLSYKQTTSYNVKLALNGAQLDGEQTQRIVTELRKALHAQGVQITAAGDKLELNASVPAGQAAGVAGVARAFAAELAMRHIDAEATVSPVKTKVQGNVYAMAMSRVINVNVNTPGRSDAEISADIKQQLAAAGFDVANVEFRAEGDKHTLKISTEGCNPSAVPLGGQQCPEINLTVDGQVSPGSSRQLKIKIDKQPGDTDEAIRQRILDQIHAQGMDANVVVQDGKIVSIDPITR